MSYKFGILTPGDKDFVSNGLRFATEDEAKQYGNELLSRWFTAVLEEKVLESEDAVNYVFVDGHAKPIEQYNPAIEIKFNGRLKLF